MLTKLVMSDPSITINDILNLRLGVKGIMNEMKELETLEFISKIRGHEHIALLYRNEISKNKILSKFFDPHTTGCVSRGILLVKKPNNDFSDFRSTNILYKELLSQNDRTNHGITKILSDWIAKLHSSNRSEKEPIEEEEGNTIQTTRIAEEDATWWLEMVLIMRLFQLKSYFIKTYKKMIFLFYVRLIDRRFLIFIVIRTP
jgi:hypothetical protein